MAIKIDGRPQEIVIVPRLVKAIKELLDQQPKDEVFTTLTFANMVKRSTSHLYTFSSHPSLTAYILHFNQNTYWGHPEAIAALKKERGL